jgi:hypothetical protein
MKSLIFIIASIFIISACSSASNTTASGKQPVDFEQLAANIESGNYTYTVRSASPSGGRTVQITSTYVMKAENGSYEALLPYFGRVYSGGYGQGGSVEFKGEPEDLQITRKDNKNKLTLSFSIKSDTETYLVKLDVGKSGFGNLVISSPKRQTISYYGVVGSLKD